MLVARECSKRFGGVEALSRVSLEARAGEIVGIIGPNGAGKTTLFDVISGFTPLDRGTVSWRGRDITALPAHSRAALGIARTFQNVGLVGASTVLDNLLLAQHLQAGYSSLSGLIGLPSTTRTERMLRRRATALAELFGLSDQLGVRVADLPYGVQKQVTLAAALGPAPELVLLDEPSSGMAPEEAAELGGRLSALRRQLGLSVLMIEHHVPLVMDVCDYVYCLSFGRVLAEGLPSEVRRDPQVVQAYLGGEAVDDRATAAGRA